MWVLKAWWTEVSWVTAMVKKQEVCLLHAPEEETPLIILSHSQAVPGSFLDQEKKKKRQIPDMLIKSDSPPLGILVIWIQVIWFSLLEKENLGEHLHPRHWGQIWRWVTFVHLFNKYLLSSQHVMCDISLVTKSCLTPFGPTGCSLPGKNTGVSCCFYSLEWSSPLETG